MRVFLEYAVNLVNKRAFLRAGYRLCVGSSRLADLHIDGAPQLEPRHFELVHLGEKVVLRNLVAAKPLTVNHSPLAEDQSLTHDDRITAGGLTFRLIIESDSVPITNVAAMGVPAAALTLAAVSEAEVSEDLIETALPSGVLHRQWKGSHWQKNFSSFLEGEAETSTVICLVNFKKSEKPFPADCTDEVDLVRNASDTLRAENSLHLVGTGELADAQKTLQASIEAGQPITLIHGSLEKGALQEKLPLYATWMVDPETLGFHLRQNTKRLLAQWFQIANGFVIYSGGSEIDHYSHPGTRAL